MDFSTAQPGFQTMNQIFTMRSFIAALIFSASVATTAAHAQLGIQAGFVEAFQPDYLNRDITIFIDFLALEEWQEPTVESLLHDYSGDFKVGVDGLRDQMKGMKDQIISAGDKGAMGVIMGPINKWSQEKARLKQRFIDNIRSVLSDEQQQRWPQLERAMRREKELPRGLLSGESIDLRQISRECEVPPDVMLAAKETLDQYEVGLDAALLARTNQMNISQDPIKESMVAQDFTRGLKELELIVATRVALRDLQERSIETIATAYGTQWGPVFRTKALSTAYPAVFRPSPMIPYFAAARELSGLSPEQLSQLNALEVEYVTFYEGWRVQLAALYRVEEPKKQTEETRRRLNQGAANAEKAPRDPYQAMHAERDAMDSKTREKIAAIVGPELALQLPGAAKIASAANRPMVAPKEGSNAPSLSPATDGPRGRNGADSKMLSRPENGRSQPQSPPAKTID